MESSLKGTRHAAAWPALVVSLAAAMPVWAADDATPANKGGLLTLPNVRIVTATPAQRQLAAPGTSLQARAFKDPVTGRLRAPTPEELIEIGMQPEPATAPAVVRTLANGTRAAALGDEAMSHSIVRVSAGGRMQTECVTGSQAMSRALAGGIAQEGRHDDHQ